jgi:hypothetical protein
MTITHRLRRRLAGPRTDHEFSGARRHDREALVRAVLLVRVFYLAIFFLDVILSENWQRWLRTTSFALLWPLRFFQWTGPHVGVGIVVIGSLSSALLAAILPERRIARVLAAMGLLLYGALWNSFGIVMHGWHAWIWCAIIFCFLPDLISNEQLYSRRREQSYLRIFWIAQACVLFFYSLAGSFKLAGAVLQIAQGKHSAFSADALARHVVYAISEGSHHFAFGVGPWIANHPALAQPFFLMAIYLESCSLVVAFRPRAHRVWGVFLICFHIGIFLSMEILFSWQMLLVGILLVCSPFDRAQWTLRERIASLPLVAEALALARRIRNASCAHSSIVIELPPTHATLPALAPPTMAPKAGLRLSGNGRGI